MQVGLRCRQPKPAAHAASAVRWGRDGSRRARTDRVIRELVRLHLLQLHLEPSGKLVGSCDCGVRLLFVRAGQHGQHAGLVAEHLGLGARQPQRLERGPELEGLFALEQDEALWHLRVLPAAQVLKEEKPRTRLVEAKSRTWVSRKIMAGLPPFAVIRIHPCVAYLLTGLWCRVVVLGERRLSARRISCSDCSEMLWNLGASPQTPAPAEGFFFSFPLRGAFFFFFSPACGAFQSKPFRFRLGNRPQRIGSGWKGQEWKGNVFSMHSMQRPYTPVRAQLGRI